MTARAPDQLGISAFSFIKLIKKFSKAEMNDFAKFLRSPFHNNHKTIVRLFDELRKYHPHFSDDRLTKKYLFQVAGRSVAYDDTAFRKYMSRLFKLGEEYLSFIEFRSSKDVVDHNVLIQYNKRDADELYNKKLHELEKSLSMSDVFDFKTSLLKHKIKGTNFSRKIRNFNYDKYTSDVYESHLNLMNYFLFCAVSNYNQLIVDRSSISTDIIKNPIEIFFSNFDINNYLSEIKEQDKKFYHDHLLSLELLTDDLMMNSKDKGRDAYERLKNMVACMPDNLSKQMQHYLFTRLATYCMVNFHNDEDAFTVDLFKHFRDMLERDLYTINDKPNMSLLDYRAIMNSALRVGEVTWVEEFLYKFIDLIKEESRDNLLNYGMANVNFARGEFEESLERMSKLKIESYVLNVDIYILKSQVLYELGFMDSAKDLAESFRHHVSSNLLYSPELKNRLTSYIRFYMKLIRASKHFNKRIISSLRRELKENDKSLKLKWLTEKADLIWNEAEKR